ncbi:FUSC family protein [Paraburkholderia acidisoli]|uniref:FUSC family protein n=1 Tax=Paraburkholderia acidisoli TaxID=2571748 RepID=A0A7Z2GJT1_9BURK|nr:FUSC family protein [Paraburkholderia acidisoli]QGZ63076.1 FUSC family protein [Paraburkholderia acidisoli]
MSQLLSSLRDDFAVYRHDDFPRLLHAWKAALAIVLSMLVCMRIELRSPSTAMVSAVIVMLAQQSGMVIARSFYRTLGLVVGCIAGLTLIALFAQAPAFFIVGLSIWIGLFVAGSSYYKNVQSYGFVLSGYAACITSVPEWRMPYDAIHNVIYTTSEVVVGVAMGSLVSALVFPGKVVPALLRWRQSALAALLNALREAAQGDAAALSEASYLALVRSGAALEDLRTAAVFEDPEMRLRNEALMELDRSFLHAATRIYALHRARQRALRADDATREQAQALCAQLAPVHALAGAQQGMPPGGDIAALRGRLAALEATLPAEVNALTPPSHDTQTVPVAAIVGAEAWSTVSSLTEFCGACSATFGPPRIRLTRSVLHAIAFMRSASFRADGAEAAISGLRATVSVIVVGAAWFASGWDNGFSAVLGAGITSGFFSINPTPAAASWQAFVGCLFACVVGFVVNFVLMPGFGDVTLLALCLGIFVFLGSYVNTLPGMAILGATFNIYLCYILTPTNLATYNPPYILDRGFALLIGIGAAAVAFSLVIPREAEWLVKRYAQRIRGVMLHAARDTLDTDDAAQIDLSMRDLVMRLATVLQGLKGAGAPATRATFAQLGIVDTVVRVRTTDGDEANALPPAWHAAQPPWLAALAALAQHPNDATLDAARAATLRAVAALEAEDSANGAASDTASPAQRQRFRLRARLWSTWAALGDLLPAAAARGATPS